jgi:hypothetical protein
MTDGEQSPKVYSYTPSMQDCGWQARKAIPIQRTSGVAGIVNNAIVIATGCMDFLPCCAFNQSVNAISRSLRYAISIGSDAVPSLKSTHRFSLRQMAWLPRGKTCRFYSSYLLHHM